MACTACIPCCWSSSWLSVMGATPPCVKAVPTMALKPFHAQCRAFRIPTHLVVAAAAWKGAPCVAGVAAGRNGRSSLWHSVSLAHARSSHPLACVDSAQVQLGDLPETWEFSGHRDAFLPRKPGRPVLLHQVCAVSLHSRSAV